MGNTDGKGMNMRNKDMNMNDKEIELRNKVIDMVKDSKYEAVYTCYTITYYDNGCIKCRFLKVCREISSMINDK